MIGKIQFREIKQGWGLGNVHMYAHDLRAMKDGRTVRVDCEDTTVGFVGIRADRSDLDPTVFDDLFNALYEWARMQKFNFRLYKSRKLYVTGKSPELKVEPDDSYASRSEYIFKE